MRSLKITVALAAIACVVGALASPAFAKNEKPKEFFGEFLASRVAGGPITPEHPAIAKTKEATLDEFFVGGETTGPFAFVCKPGPTGSPEEGGITAEAKVISERSPTIKVQVKFHKCVARRRLRGGLEEPKLKTKIEPLEMEFHSNGAFVLGKEENNELKITKGSEVSIAVKGGMCHLKIPSQTVPKEVINEEKEYEGGEYSGEKEPTEKMKLYPDGFKERIEIDWTLSKITIDVPTEKNSGCEYAKEPGGKFNPETKEVEFPAHFEGEMEELEIKKGELFFETRKEHEEKI